MGYAYQAVVVIPAAVGSVQTNITVVFSGTDTKLRTVANGGAIKNTVTRVGQVVPADLILSSDILGLSLYNWGWDFYDAVNGIATIWVKIPSLSNLASTTIYVSIGNVAVTIYQGGAQGSEFDSNVNGIWHCPDGTTLNLKDFSSNANNFTTPSTLPTVTTGKIDGGVNFPAGAYGAVASNATLTPARPFTVSLWAKFTSTGNLVIFEKDGNNGFSVQCQNNAIKMTVGSDITSSSITNDGNWHYFAFTVASAGLSKAYVDGNNTTLSGPVVNPSYSTGNLLLGSRTGSFTFTGSVDDVKITQTDRTANWIATEYANQNNPPVIGTFLAIVVGGQSSLMLFGVQ